MWAAPDCRASPSVGCTHTPVRRPHPSEEHAIKISRITWENYRRIADGDIQVRRHLVLIGPNDSGKSSILRIPDLCLGATRGQLLGGLGPRDFTDPAKPLKLAVTLNDLSSNEAAAFPDEIDDVTQTVTVYIQATLDASSDDEATQVETLDVQRTCLRAGHANGISRVQKDMFSWAYVSASRSLSRELSTPGGAMATLLRRLDLTSDQAALDEAAAAVREVVRGSSAIQGFCTELAATLGEVLSGLTGAESIKVVTPAELGSAPLAGMSVAIDSGGALAPLAEQSDGVRALSTLALLGMSRSSARIVGIDEPETHLHTTAQRVVGRNLRAATGQRLLATHSTTLVEQWDPLDIVALGSAGAPRQLPADAPVIADIGIRVKYWVPNLLSTLTAKKLLFVEGPSDRIFLESLHDLLGLNFDRDGVAVVALSSADAFGRSYRLLGPQGFNVPAWGIVDEDHRQDWAKHVGVAADLLESKNVLVCDPDLEGLYCSTLGVERVFELLGNSSAFTPHKILSTMRVNNAADVTLEDVKAFCGDKTKVRAAGALADEMTGADAEKFVELAAFLRRVATA